MPAPSSTLTTGLNAYYLIELIEQLSQLSVGYNENVDDINQDLVLQFIKEGYQRIVSLDTRWPWFQSTYSFDTVNNQRTYSSNFDLTATFSPYIAVYPAAAGTNVSITTIREIISCTNNTLAGNELIYIDQFKAESIWVGTSDQPDIPAYWSLWGNQINLWPKPNGVFSITTRGYREPSLTWLTESNNSLSTDYVDLDPEFHIMLVNFVLARIFQFQEDAEMANVYMQHYNAGVTIAKSNLTAPNSNQPLIMSGGLLLNGAQNTAYGNRYGQAGILVQPGPLGRMY